MGGLVLLEKGVALRFQSTGIDSLDVHIVTIFLDTWKISYTGFS